MPYEVFLLEFDNAVDPITVVVGYDMEYTYPGIVTDGPETETDRFSLQSFTVTPPATVSADQFTFTEDTRKIVVHGGVNFSTLVGQTHSLTLTLTNLQGLTHEFQQTITVVEYVPPSFTDKVLAPIIVYRGEPRSI